jgi:hypothetical protein
VGVLKSPVLVERTVQLMLRSERARHVVYAFFFASIAIAWRPAVFVHDRIILYWYYGPERVEREGLRMREENRAIRVSNGDLIGKDWERARTMLFWATMMPMAGLLFCSVLILVRLVAPGLYRELRYTMRAKGDDPFVRELVD